MALTFIGFAQATTANPPTPSGARAGDFVCVVAFRQGNASAPTVPSGWTTLVSRSQTPAMVVAGRIWDGNTIPAFTNATACHTIAWEGFDVGTPYGASAVGGGTTTALAFPALTTQQTNATSHVVRACVDTRPDVAMPTPAGHTVIFTTASPGSSFAYGTWRIGPVTSPGTVSITVSRSSTYSTVSFELRAAQTAPTSAPTPTFSNIAFNNVRVNWSSPTGTTERVTVQRSTASGGPYTDIADLPAATLLFNDTTVVDGLTYWYRVVTKNGAGSFTGTTASQLVPHRTLTFSGIDTAESFGTVVVTNPAPLSPAITPSGIDTAEAFGTPTVRKSNTLSITGIDTAESFGAPTAVFASRLTATGIASAEGFGALGVVARLPVYLLGTTSAGINGVNGTVNPGLPVGADTPDTLIAVVSIRTASTPAASVLAPPAGWQLLSTDVRGSVGRAWLFTKQSDGRDLTSFTIAGASGNGPFQVAVFAFRGTNPAGPIDTFASNNGTGVSPAVVGVTLTHPNRETLLRVLVSALAGTNGNVTWGTVADSAEIFEYVLSGIDSAVGTIGAELMSLSGGGASGTAPATLPASAAWVGYTVVFNTAGVTPTTKSITPSGIASTESFGALNVSRRKTLTFSGIPSAESFGSTSVVNSITNTRILSEEAFGSLTVTTTIPHTDVIASGIASQESFGTATLSSKLAVSLPGVASQEAFGNTRLSVRVSLVGIVSSEAFGATIVKRFRTVAATGISSAEAFGTTKVNRTIPLVGIASQQAFGNMKVSSRVKLTGIASGESLGTLSVKLRNTVAATGIASVEAFGTTKVNRTIPLAGIASQEAFGAARILVVRSVLPTGIPSAESFGATSVTKKYKVTLSGIVSAEAFGAFTLRQKKTITGVGKIASAEAFGAASIKLSFRMVLTGILSGEAFGVSSRHAPITIVRQRIGLTYGLITSNVTGAGEIVISTGGTADPVVSTGGTLPTPLTSGIEPDPYNYGMEPSTSPTGRELAAILTGGKQTVPITGGDEE